MTCFVTYYAEVGGGRHLYYLTPVEQTLAFKFNWLSQPWAIFAFATGKVSVALLILRLIPPNNPWIKWLLYFVIVTVLVFDALGVIITFAQCNPVYALWTLGLQSSCWTPVSNRL